MQIATEERGKPGTIIFITLANCHYKEPLYALDLNEKSSQKQSIQKNLS